MVHGLLFESLLFDFIIICSLGEKPVKITKEASRDKFQMRFQKNVQAKGEN